MHDEELGSAERYDRTVRDLSQIFSDLVWLETELWQATDARLKADFDLPLVRFKPMQVIGRLPSCRVNDIAVEMSMTVGGTSKLVDRIERAGHCRRTPNPNDRRSSVVVLTPAGKRLLVEATEAFEEELELRLGSVLSPRALQQLGASLRTLRDGASAGASAVGSTSRPIE